MTDRYIALTVLLEKEIREDDAEPLIAAIRQLRGVAEVTPHVPESIDTYWAKSRARDELLRQLIELARSSSPML